MSLARKTEPNRTSLMPLPHIDVIIWDNSDYIVASPVSPKGLQFMRELRGDSDLMAVKMDLFPSEFKQHIPPDLVVVFYRDDGKMVPVNDQKSLQ